VKGRGRLTDYLIKVFNAGLGVSPDGKRPTYNVDFKKIKQRIQKFEDEKAGTAAPTVRVPEVVVGKGKEREGSRDKTKDTAVRSAGDADVGRGKERATSKDKAKDVAKTTRVEEVTKEKDVVKTPRVEKEKEVAKAKDVVKTPRVGKDVGKGKNKGKTAEQKQVDKDAGPAVSASEGEGEEKSAKAKAPPPKELVHRDGGRMTVTRRKPVVQVKTRGKEIKSRSEVGTTDEEGEVRAKANAGAEGAGRKKPQRKPRADESDAEEPEEERNQRGRKKVQKIAEDDSESEATPKTKGKQKAVGEDTRQRKRKEESEEEVEEVTPLERARQRAESKAPAPPPADCIDVEDKCASCAKMNTSCLWTREAIKKAGPKACWRCKTRKIGCINSYRSSGPVVVDLATPLEDLVDHLSPPVSNAAGVPQSGIAGEAENPTTLGELLVEVLANIRAVKEENMELKGQMKAMQQAFDSMSVHNGQSHRQVLDAIKDLPTVPAPISIPRAWTPITFPDASQTLAARVRSPSPSPAPSLPQPINARLAMSDSEEESTGRRPASRAESSASRGNDEMEIEEVGIPSVVADRTRGKTKAVPSPAARDSDTAGSEDEEEEEESPKKTRPEKRKATAVDDPEDPVATAKKTKVTAAGKGKDAKVVPVRKPAAKKGKSAAS
jgi:hypothetical protein